MKDRRKAAIISAIVVLIMPVFFNIKAYASGQTKENHLEKDTITAVVEDDGDVSDNSKNTLIPKKRVLH